MASKIQVKRGNRADLPILADGEFGLCQDTGEIFIGNGGSNIKIYPPTTLAASNVTVNDAEGMFESTNAEGALAELAMTILEILSGAITVGKAENSNKVGGFTVAKNVPSNAVFTDTVTTINGKTGTISKADIVALGIPAQDTVYIHPDKHAISEVDGLQTALDAKETPAGAQAKVDAHANLTNNPHSVTKSQVGLGSVSNYGLATQAEAEAGTSSAKYMTPLRTKQAINALQAVKSVAGKTGTVTLTKGDVGLSNVDNTSDMDKPISTAVQTALDGKVDNSRVLTDVPVNAKFTDTVTTINGKTGAITKADIVALGIPAQDTTYSNATTSAAGLMSAADKTKLDGIETGANNYVHPTTAGNKHIPSGGAANQYLKYSANGTAVWSDLGDAPSVNGKSIWAGEEENRGTDENTIYFCY